MNKKKVIIVGVVILVVLLGVVTLSYAFLSVGEKQELANTFRSGCLNITIENESNAISLNGAYPITDVDGLSGEGYTFTIKNTCSTSSNYVINLENIDRQANSLSSDYLKVAINSDTFDNIITKLSSNEATTPTISNAYEAYILYKGKIEGNTTKTFKLREWIDYDATKEQAAEKVITNKINVIAASNIEVEEAPVIKTTLIDKTITGAITGSANTAKYCITKDMACTPNTDTTITNNTTTMDFIGYKKKIVCSNLDNGRIMCSDPMEGEQDYLVVANYPTLEELTEMPTFLNTDIKVDKIESLTTLDKIEIPEGTASFDVSEKQNKSIMAWYQDTDNNGLYEVYIGQVGGVVANPNSSYLFAYLMSLNSIDLSHFNTSNVTNMEGMFLGLESLTSLNLSDFDTSNVTNMNSMFYYDYGLTNLNVSHFNTSNVTNMEYMFYAMANLTSLDVSKFNTSNVTNMEGMFSGMGSLTSLNLSNFNTSKVTNMSVMFHHMDNLTSLDVSNFDTSNVTDMSAMFMWSYKLKNLDISNFDTSNVTDMSQMFSVTYFESLNISNFDISKVTNMEDMFGNSSISTIYVKDAATKTFIEARLTDAGCSATITVS